MTIRLNELTTNVSIQYDRPGDYLVLVGNNQTQVVGHPGDYSKPFVDQGKNYQIYFKEEASKDNDYKGKVILIDSDSGKEIKEIIIEPNEKEE